MQRPHPQESTRQALVLYSNGTELTCGNTGCLLHLVAESVEVVLWRDMRYTDYLCHTIIYPTKYTVDVTSNGVALRYLYHSPASSIWL